MMITIRPAGPADAAALMALIAELAAYQGEPEAAVGSEELLRLHLFGERPSAEVLVGLVNEAVAGFALFYPTFSVYLTRPCLCLADLYVRPDFRRAGLGRALLREVAAIAERRGVTRIEFTVLDTNAPAIAFYEACGASPTPGWTNWRLADGALPAVARGAAPAPMSGGGSTSGTTTVHPTAAENQPRN